MTKSNKYWKDAIAGWNPKPPPWLLPEEIDEITGLDTAGQALVDDILPNSGGKWEVCPDCLGKLEFFRMALRCKDCKKIVGGL